MHLTLHGHSEIPEHVWGLGVWMGKIPSKCFSLPESSLEFTREQLNLDQMASPPTSERQIFNLVGSKKKKKESGQIRQHPQTSSTSSPARTLSCHLTQLRRMSQSPFSSRAESADLGWGDLSGDAEMFLFCVRRNAEIGKHNESLQHWIALLLRIRSGSCQRIQSCHISGRFPPLSHSTQSSPCLSP